MITSFCGKIIRETKYKLLLQLAYFYRRCLKKILVCFLMGHSVYTERPAVYCDCISLNIKNEDFCLFCFQSLFSSTSHNTRGDLSRNQQCNIYRTRLQDMYRPPV